MDLYGESYCYVIGLGWVVLYWNLCMWGELGFEVLTLDSKFEVLTNYV